MIYTYIKTVFVQYDYAIALNHAETRLHRTCFCVLLVCRVRVVSSISVSLCVQCICFSLRYRESYEKLMVVCTHDADAHQQVAQNNTHTQTQHATKSHHTSSAPFEVAM